MAQHETKTSHTDTKHHDASRPAEKAPFPMSFSEWMKPESWSRWTSSEPFVNAVEQQLTRVGAMADEFAKVEKTALEQVQTAVQEMSRLTLASIDYTSRVAGELRKSALEASRRSAEVFRSRS